ncbi:coniferyl-alcohol dehydrogenase [Rhodococcus koreensis]
MDDVVSSYADRTVLVTGCSSGIGAAVATRLAGAGANVIGVDLQPPGNDVGFKQFIRTDLGDLTSIDAAVEALPEELGAMFHCAGISAAAAIPETVLRVNFIGLRELLERTEDRILKGGAIALTSSRAGRRYEQNWTSVINLVRSVGFTEAVRWAEEHADYVSERGGYHLSKEAIILYALDRCFSLGERGVRINVVAPGPTCTPLLKQAVKLKGEGLLTEVPQPLGYISSAEEQANILIFLNSDFASYVNGQTIWSDGGGVNADILAAD